jgi:hypothetical protein
VISQHEQALYERAVEVWHRRAYRSRTVYEQPSELLSSVHHNGSVVLRNVNGVLMVVVQPGRVS